jgi:hypothetical protein
MGNSGTMRGLMARKARAVTLASASLMSLAGLVGADEPDPKALVQVKKHMARIGEEVLGYRGPDGKQTLPSAIRGRDDKPLLSWRVAILPQLGHDELFRQFKLDEPWDGPTNKPLLEKMPPIFAPFGPGPNPVGSTCFQLITGPGTLFDGKKSPDFRSIPDGAEATLLMVEAAEAVPWTKPSDVNYDPKGPIPALGDHFEEGGLGVFADGSVAFIKSDIDEPTLRALFTRAGAEEVARTTLRDHVVPIRRR